MRKRALWIALGVVVVAVAAWITVIVVSNVTVNPRQTISLSEIYGHNDHQYAAFNGMHEDTAALCASAPGCIQGYAADHAAFRRFSSLDAAREFAHKASDAYQSDWIVIEYTDSTLSAAQRDEIQGYLNGLATSG